jgi:hypothetical protein
LDVRSNSATSLAKFNKEFPLNSDHYKNRRHRIAGNFRFAFSAMLCDNKQKVESHRFSGRNWMSNFICEECWASKKFEEFNFADHSDDAAWRHAKVTHQQYILQTNEEATTRWKDHPGWQLDRNIRDMMHNIYCGGPMVLSTSPRTVYTAPPTSADPVNARCTCPP